MIKHKYEIIIYWSEDDACFIAEVPELSGCMADGNSHLEAMEKAHVVIGEWLQVAKEENRNIPSPKGKLAYA